MQGEWRGITSDDVPAWAALLAAAEKIDQTGEHYSEADLHEELDDQQVGPLDRVAAWEGDRMVAFAAVRPRSVTSYLRVHAEGTVDPDRRQRGLGGEGLSWIRKRSREIRAERAPDKEIRVQIVGFLDDADQVALLERAGYSAVNWSATMRVHLDRRTPAAATPGWHAGYTLRTYTREHSEAVRAAHNAAFVDHWGFTSWDESMWRQWEDDSRNARHDMSWLVFAEAEPGTVAGYILTHEYDAYEQATGRREAYLAKIGVRREHRGRGLASNLLRHVLDRCDDAGYDEAALDVDTNNPTGAFGLYERAGLVIERRTATFEQVHPAPGTADDAS